MNIISKKDTKLQFKSLIDNFLSFISEKGDDIVEALERMNLLRGDMHIVRDNYYSNVLNRCYEMKKKKPETFKYLLEIIFERTKNRTENSIILDT